MIRQRFEFKPSKMLQWMRPAIIYILGINGTKHMARHKLKQYRFMILTSVIYLVNLFNFSTPERSVHFRWWNKWYAKKSLPGFNDAENFVEMNVKDGIRKMLRGCFCCLRDLRGNIDNKMPLSASLLSMPDGWRVDFPAWAYGSQLPENSSTPSYLYRWGNYLPHR